MMSIVLGHAVAIALAITVLMIHVMLIIWILDKATDVEGPLARCVAICFAIFGIVFVISVELLTIISTGHHVG